MWGIIKICPEFDLFWVENREIFQFLYVCGPENGYWWSPSAPSNRLLQYVESMIFWYTDVRNQFKNLFLVACTTSHYRKSASFICRMRPTFSSIMTIFRVITRKQLNLPFFMLLPNHFSIELSGRIIAPENHQTSLFLVVYLVFK